MKYLLLIFIMTLCSRSYHYPHITEEDALAIFSSYTILKDHPPFPSFFLLKLPRAGIDKFKKQYKKEESED